MNLTRRLSAAGLPLPSQAQSKVFVAHPGYSFARNQFLAVGGSAGRACRLRLDHTKLASVTLRNQRFLPPPPRAPETQTIHQVFAQTRRRRSFPVARPTFEATVF